MRCRSGLKIRFKRSAQGEGHCLFLGDGSGKTLLGFARTLSKYTFGYAIGCIIGKFLELLMSKFDMVSGRLNFHQNITAQLPKKL